MEDLILSTGFKFMYNLLVIFFPPLMYKLLVIFMYKLHILFSAPKLPTSMMTYDSYPMGVWLLEATVDMVSMAFTSGQSHLSPHVLEQSQSTQEL
jgi:hypothetical protein